MKIGSLVECDLTMTADGIEGRHTGMVLGHTFSDPRFAPGLDLETLIKNGTLATYRWIRVLRILVGERVFTVRPMDVIREYDEQLGAWKKPKLK